MGQDKLRALEQQKQAQREAAAAASRALIAAGRFEEAEAAMKAGDPTIQGGVTLARLYEDRLRELVAQGATAVDRAGVEAVFARAKDWWWRCYPDPHTAYEAEHYWSGRAEDLARLVGILGYEPGHSNLPADPE